MNLLTYFLYIYYCSKLHHRWLKKVGWSNNCGTVELPIYDEATFGLNCFFRTSTFWRLLLFLKQLYVFTRATFPENAVFRTANFRLLTLFSHLQYLSLSNQPTNTKSPGGVQSGCTSHKIFLLIPWTKILHRIYLLRTELNRTVYQKM